MQVFRSRREDGSLSTWGRLPLDVRKPRSRREGLPYAEHFRILCRTLQEQPPKIIHFYSDDFRPRTNNTSIFQSNFMVNSSETFLSDCKSKLLFRYDKIYSKVFFNILIYRGFFYIYRNLLLFLINIWYIFFFTVSGLKKSILLFQ